MSNYYLIDKITEKEFEDLKTEAKEWCDIDFGNYCCLMFDIDTEELWVDIYLGSNWGEYHNGAIMDLGGYIGLRTGKSFLDCTLKEVVDFALKAKHNFMTNTETYE